MVDELTALIMDSIEKAKEQKSTREISLVITKLEEALLWWSQAQHTKNLQQAS